MVKAVAEARGWEHGRHNNLYVTIRRLVAEQGDFVFLDLFQIAGELHTNFYEGYLDTDDVESRLQDVAHFVDIMEELRGTT